MDQKRVMCEWTKNVKPPNNYASNLARYMDMREGKISNMKSHIVIFSWND